MFNKKLFISICQNISNLRDLFGIYNLWKENATKFLWQINDVLYGTY